MEQEKRSRTGARRTTLAVLEILKEDTNPGKPISITELVSRLEWRYGLHPNRDSVKAALSDLMEFYPGPDKIRCRRSEKNDRYQYQYYYQTGSSAELQDNLQTIQRVMGKNRGRRKTEFVLSFRLNGYGSDKALHASRRIEGVLPIRVLQAFGHPYLIGFFRGGHHPSHFRIDLMTEIQSREEKREADEQREFQAGAVDRMSDQEYLSTHPYMFYERPGDIPRWIRFRIKKLQGKPVSSLTFLQDLFGDGWRPIQGTETDSALEVWVQCLPSAAAQFAWQYMDRVRVLEPIEVKEQVEQALRKYYDQFFET